MSRLSARDRILVALGIGLWVVCFALHVRTRVIDQRSAWLLLGASIAGAETSDDYPTIRTVAPGSNWARASGLQPGDRLVRLGDADLRGVGAIGFYVRATAEAGPDHWVKVEVERGGVVRRGEWSLARPSSGVPWWAGGLAAIAGLGITFLVLLRAPDSTPTRLFFLSTLSFEILLMGFAGGSVAQTYASLIVGFLAAPICLYATARLWQSLPDGGTRWPGDRAVAATFAVVVVVLGASILFGTPLSWQQGEVALGWFWVAWSLFLLIRFSFNYRRASPAGRRRIKWLALGLYGATVCVAGATLAALSVPSQYWLPGWATLTTLLVPLGLLISVLRFDLFDIDRLFSRTLAVSIAGVALLAAGLFGLPRVAELLGDATGIAAGPSSAVLAAALAIAVIPAQRVLRPRIERVLFAGRYAIDAAIERLLADLEDVDDPQQLAVVAGERLDAAFHPTACVAYLRDAESHIAAVLVRGIEAVPAFDADGPLAAALRGRREVLAGAAAGHVTVDARDPFQRAALEAVGVAVLLPFHRGGELAGFIGLGPRASGDVYTPTDRALLAAVGSKLSSRLAQLDDRRALARSRDLGSRMREYVPGVIAEQVEAGADLGGREQEVSVLFVDVRGYSSYAQGRPVGEVFSAISQYTDLVTRIVRDAGGAVVEFNGDGMMAVFGAPILLPDKAARALGAARRIAEQVGRAAVAGGSFSVGVGIATGSAYVGSIRGADRSIWTALGETTNLAARLQVLARELGASIVIDDATRRLAGAAATQGFERRESVAIRGREGTETLYCLPLAHVD